MRFNRKKGPVATTVLKILFFGIIAFSGLKIFDISMEYKAADDVQATLLELKPTKQTDDSSQEQDASVQNQSIWEKYSDVVGWLTVDHTSIDYCFAKAEDNNKYLRHTLDGEYVVSGTLFMDYRCESDLSGFNSIVFGHNMNNGTMFGDLPKFADVDYFNAHSTGTVYLKDKEYTLEIFAYLVVESTDIIIYDPYITQSVLNNYVKEKSLIYRQTDLPETNRVLTLSTCNYDFDGARSILIGKLIENNG